MDDFQALMERLNKQAIGAAKQLDPEFAAKVDADRREIEEHERRLTAKTSTQKTEPIEQRKPPSDPDEPPEKEILERVNHCLIERRSL